MAARWTHWLPKLSMNRSDRELLVLKRILHEDLLKVIPREAISETLEKAYDDTIIKILDGQPVQYALGTAHFYGYDFKVNSSVLIPRPETEELVHLTVDRLRSRKAGSRILDVGTGSGCIAISTMLQMQKTQGVKMVALDVSEDAVKLANQNARRLGAAVDIIEQDFADESLWSALGVFDAIVSNPPYIRPSERPLMSSSTLRYEPPTALFTAEDDPIFFYRLLAKFARDQLSSAGLLMVEINEFLGEEVIRVLAELGFSDSELLQDLSGRDRFVVGTNSGN